MLTPDLVALIMVANVAFVYGYCRLVRKAWPHGHPWSGLAFLLPAVGLFIRGEHAMEGRPSIYSNLCFALGFVCAIVWLFGAPWKWRGK